MGAARWNGSGNDRRANRISGDGMVSDHAARILQAWNIADDAVPRAFRPAGDPARQHLDTGTERGGEDREGDWRVVAQDISLTTIIPSARV